MECREDGFANLTSQLRSYQTILPLRSFAIFMFFKESVRFKELSYKTLTIGDGYVYS